MCWGGKQLLFFAKKLKTHASQIKNIAYDGIKLLVSSNSLSPLVPNRFLEKDIYVSVNHHVTNIPAGFHVYYSVQEILTKSNSR